MAEQLTPATNSAELTERVHHLELPGSDLSHVSQEPVVIAEMSGNLGEFIDAAFPERHLGQLVGQLYDREPGGRGAHFDVYIHAINRDYFPYIALFNLSGHVAVKATTLDEELANIYHADFPDPRDSAAYEARRNISKVALQRPSAKIYEGELAPGEGLIIPQREGRHVIHDIIPDDPENPGRYLKIVAPGKTTEAGEILRSVGYRPLDQLIVKTLVAIENIPSTDEASALPKKPEQITLQPQPRRRWPSGYDEKPPCSGLD